MAITAAVVTAAAAVASAGVAAYSASQKKGGGSGSSGSTAPPVPPLWERVFKQDTVGLMNESRAVMSDALMQGNLMQPELYHLLGYEPVYDESSRPNIAALGAERDRLRAATDATQKEINSITGIKPKERTREQREKLDSLRETQRQNMNALSLSERQLQDAQTTPPRMIGLKPLEGGPVDPTGSANNAYRQALDLENDALIRALKGEAPIDQTMVREFDDKERALRERLRRTLGPDYETSTAGQRALADFSRQRAEAFQSYNRDSIGMYSQLTESRAASLSNLTTARMEQLLAPSQAAATRASQLDSLVDTRTRFLSAQAQSRGVSQGGVSGGGQGGGAGVADWLRLGGQVAGGIGSAAQTIANSRPSPTPAPAPTPAPYTGSTGFTGVA